MKYLIVITIVVMTGLLMWFGSNQTLRNECETWNYDAIENSENPNFYFTTWQVEQCKDMGRELPNNVNVR